MCGPFPVQSLSRSRNFISFIDNTTRFTVVIFLKQKSEAFATFCKYKQLVQNQTSRTIKKVRNDNGEEYVSQEWDNFFDKNGIIHQKTIPYTPHQNGIAERKNRTLLNATCSLLKTGQIKQWFLQWFWEDAIPTTCYLQNQTSHTALQGEILFTLWYSDIPDVSHLKCFGAVAYVYVNPHHISKLDDRCFRERFIGYGEQNGVKAYKIFNPQTCKTIYSMSIKFDQLSLLQRNGDTISNEDGEDHGCLPHLVESEHNNIQPNVLSCITSPGDAAKQPQSRQHTKSQHQGTTIKNSSPCVSCHNSPTACSQPVALNIITSSSH